MPNNVFWGTHAALAGNASPTIMMIGDSWFWYPFDNLAREIGDADPARQIVVVGRNGSEAAEWDGRQRKDIDFAFRMYGGSVGALMLSGGGNDVAGMNDFLRLIKDDCAAQGTVAGCYRTAQPAALLAGVMGCYRALITKFRAYNASAPVILHHYDYAWPTGLGLFSPSQWLKAPMERAGVHPQLRKELFRDLINQLKAAQLQLASDATLGPVYVALTAGQLPDSMDAWANEMHPTPAGFRLLARNAFEPELARVPTN